MKKNSKANTKASCLNKKNEIKQPNTHPSQRTKTVESQKNLIITPTDKNLGPAIMDTLSYTQQVLKEHLLTSTYKQLTVTEAKNKMEAIKTTLKLLLTGNQNLLSVPEWTYF